MLSTRTTCLGVIMVLLICHSRAKPLSSLQSLSRLLEDNFEHSYVSDEAPQERGDLEPTDSLDQTDPEIQWSKNRLTLEQLLNDPEEAPRRFRTRSKKGFPRGCFGVKLDRIGSLSGLGC